MRTQSGLLLLAGFLASSAAPAPELPVFRASGVATPTRSRVELPGRFLRGSSGGRSSYSSQQHNRNSGDDGGGCEEDCGEGGPGVSSLIATGILIPVILGTIGITVCVCKRRQAQIAAEYEAKAEECLAQGYDRRSTTARQMATTDRSYAHAWTCDLRTCATRRASISTNPSIAAMARASTFATPASRGVA